MTNWWWVRHGPTHEKAFVGWRDVPADLSDTARISRLNAHLPIGALLVSSDLTRSITTADAIGAGRERLAHSSALREFNFGDWDGLGFNEVSEQDPLLSRAYWETPGDVTPPNGESWNEAAARVDPFVAKMNADHSGRDIIVVAHMGIILTRIQRASGQTAKQTLRHEIANFSVTQLNWDGNWAIDQINHQP